MLGNDLCMELLRATELAAIESKKFAGMGSEKDADRAAVNAMRSALNDIEIDGTIVIGEGERDSAPMLYIGEKVGKGGMKLDIAVDPLEGTTTCASYKGGAMSVIAVARPGCLLGAPDVYMDKIAVGPGVPDNVVSLKNDIETNLRNLSDVKGRKVGDLVVVILNRARHESTIAKLRGIGARVKLIDDGDIAAVISLITGGHDMYLGIGGGPEGVLSAAVLESVGGYMEGRLIFDTSKLLERAKAMGIEDPNRVYKTKDMAKGDTIFVATGITDGEILQGVTYGEGRLNTSSMIISSEGVITRVNREFYTNSL